MNKPFVKWAGGKEAELKHILPALPKKINKYVEPFVGGGALYFALSSEKILSRHINDFSDELYQLYLVIANSFDSFEKETNYLMHNWTVLEKIVQNNSRFFFDCYSTYKVDGNDTSLDDKLTDFAFSHNEEFNGLLRAGKNAEISNFESEIKKSVKRKIKRIKKLDIYNNFTKEEILNNIETAFKAGYYTHLRNLYNKRNDSKLSDFFNNSKKSAYFYFLREYCYSSMFRYNKKGEFNVPYGGMGYNKKSIMTKVVMIKETGIPAYLKETEICNSDFEEFLNSLDLGKDDFVFLDPPYDSEFSEYARNSFTRKDQKRLADWAKKTKAKIMIVIKNTDFILNLYSGLGFNISSFDKKYMVNFNNRNDRKVKHLLITNY